MYYKSGDLVFAMAEGLEAICLFQNTTNLTFHDLTFYCIAHESSPLGSCLI